MKHLKSKFGSITLAAILSALLLLPIAVQTIHAFDGHQHEICYDFSTHLHKKQLDCSIHDFHFSTFNFTPYPLIELIAPSIFSKVENHLLESIGYAYVANTFLRGPPSLS